MKTPCPIIILRTIYHRAFVFHVQIGPGKDKNPIDFRVIKSKVNVKRVTFVKMLMFSALFLEN